MKRGDDLIVFIRRYFDGDPEARVSLYLTSADKDHRDWVGLLNSQPTVYVDAFATPHHGRKRKAGIENAVVAWQTKRKAMKALKQWRRELELRQATDLGNGQHTASRLSTEDPPRVAQFALLMIPTRSREHLLGDLEEEYRTIVLPQCRRFWAKAWYWEQTLLALGFYVWPFLKKVLGMAVIWKLIGR